MAEQRGYRTIRLRLPRTKAIANVYTSPRIADALNEIMKDATLYEGVRLTQVMEAVYIQGQKDGALAAFNEVDRGLNAAKRLLPHRKPGRPRKTSRRRP